MADLYNILERLTLSIGNGCKVSISMMNITTLEFVVEWIDDNIHLRYIRCVSIHEMRYIKDLKVFIDWFAFMAIREYKLKTVGEE